MNKEDPEYIQQRSVQIQQVIQTIHEECIRTQINIKKHLIEMKELLMTMQKEIDDYMERHDL